MISPVNGLSPQLAQECERRTGGVLVEIYGCTEAGQVASRRTALGESWHAFGELALRAAPPSAQQPEGGFVVQGGHVDEPTPLADVLELDDPQRFRLLGRVNDLIHVAGKRSSLGHLNYHLNSLPGVEDGAFWMPPDLADRVVRTIAFVVAYFGVRAQIPPRLAHVAALASIAAVIKELLAVIVLALFAFGASRPQCFRRKRIGRASQ